MKHLVVIVFTVFLFLTLANCGKENGDPVGEIKFEIPANFPTTVYDFSKNPITLAGFELGRELFYDPILSRDSTIACGDCHISFSAFSHVDHTTSHGIDGLFGRRNAPAIQNLAWRNQFFWDGGVPHLDLVPLNAIQNPVEMDENPAQVLVKLNRHHKYPAKFKNVFPAIDSVSSIEMLKALSQFMNMLVSANSRYDQSQRGDIILIADEQAGMTLFRAKCESCHSGTLFTDQSFRNNGILNDFSHDGGRFEVSTFSDDLGKFSVPSLRNIEKTPPYMHNGKFKTLESVLEHYASGVKESPTLDPLLKQQTQLGIPLTETEKTQIIAFLKTLTDIEFCKDVRFQKK